jgi:hypothetical protein
MTEDLQKRRERMAALISGAVPPPNPFAKYLIDELKRNNAAGEQARARLNAARQQIVALENEANTLAVRVDQHLADLEKWDRMLTEEVPTDSEVNKNGDHAKESPNSRSDLG